MQNALNSRAKAKAAGRPLGRKKRGDPILIMSLRSQGHSIRKIAALAGVSTTAVSRRIAESKSPNQGDLKTEKEE